MRFIIIRKCLFGGGIIDAIVGDDMTHRSGSMACTKAAKARGASAIEGNAPATSADVPDKTRALRSVLAAPTPRMMLATETRPSFAPRTAARSHGALSL